jgi:transposase, IS30 family
MEKYTRLTACEREEISRQLSQKRSLRKIAASLERHVSTISREVRGGSCNIYTYRAQTAQKRSRRNASKRKKDHRKIDENTMLKSYIFSKLKLKWSPQQIARMLIKSYPFDMEMRISPETVYSYLYVLPRGRLKKELLACLRGNRKRRHAQRRGATVARNLEDMLSIEERPKEIENRIVPGHWEGDLIVGKYNRSALGTLVERTTRTTILVPIKSRESRHVARAFAREICKLPKQMRLTLTYDQGREMAAHKLFTKASGMKVYFAHPRSPWERGTNENTNGLIRQFFPKGTEFNNVSRYKIKKVQDLLNGRPRETLDFDCPFEVFDRLIHQQPLR